MPRLNTKPRAPGSDSSTRGLATKCSATAAATVAVEGQRELYGQLCKKLKEVERLAGIQGLLSWDEQVFRFVNVGARVTPGPLPTDGRRKQ